jgi:hypothetical protein
MALDLEREMMLLTFQRQSVLFQHHLRHVPKVMLATTRMQGIAYLIIGPTFQVSSTRKES